MSRSAPFRPAARGARRSPAQQLLGHRLVVVTGKGGAGTSTVAAALGLAAVRRERHAIVVEVAGRGDVARLIGAGELHAYAEHAIAPGVDHVSVDPSHALREYLARRLPSRAAMLLLAAGPFELLTAAAPGLAELLTIGRVWDLAQPAPRSRGGRRRRSRRHGHDVVILDAPSTGHALALLRAPGTYAVATTGPVAVEARAIDAFLRDGVRTAIVAVAAAEAPAVAETLALRAALRDQLGRDLDRAVVDGVLPDDFDAGEERAVAALPRSRARRAARFAAARARQQRHELAELTRGLDGVPVTTLPYVFAPALGPGELDELSRVLDR